MAKNHGAKQQKRVAKQKAKRSAKRTLLHRLTSKDPTIRLQQAEKWPVVEARLGPLSGTKGSVTRRSHDRGREGSSLRYSSWMSTVSE